MDTLQILLVEDNPGDVRLTQEALKQSDFRTTLQVVGDGEEALRFLRKENGFAQVFTPDLVLLDLNLPKKNGFEVLETLRQDKNFKQIPVVVLTTSVAEEDIIRTHHANANCYISKPFDFTQFLMALQIINQSKYSPLKVTHDI
ncbi:response regulator [Rhodocytophaga aerolata]|jgi:CheY-like chemotaxis protein|uniref:Response regulator n=1 Tax=Rhodocytophaga aerolata TaxID=455078 RepID=A0ABT8RA82_9BACT|nr:response regulator [Rhodocytophaga aerolata]MDO1449013.1 response regulator [Rhodocytophaga aerolata]